MIKDIITKIKDISIYKGFFWDEHLILLKFGLKSAEPKQKLLKLISHIILYAI